MGALAGGISRDPIGERGGLNIYGFVNNAPSVDIDVLGLWAGLRLPGYKQHQALTERSLKDALYGLFLPSPSEKCINRIAKELVDANIAQDSGASGADLVRHFNRQFIFREIDEDKEESRVEAREGYSRYLVLEEDNFKKPILNTKTDCWERLQVLGRLSHSWQDYYAHGIHAQQGFLDPIGGSPKDPEFWPSSYNSPTGLVDGEHPNLAEPVSVSSQRYQQALDYVKDRYRKMLVGWMLTCSCECER